MARQRKDHPRLSQATQRSLCGMAFPLDLMVPDGGQACADIRWYCKDAKSCTERWTARLPGTGRLASIPSVGEPGPQYPQLNKPAGVGIGSMTRVSGPRGFGRFPGSAGFAW